MASVIFSGNKVQALKAGLKLSSHATIWSGNINPASAGFAANQGDAYISTSTYSLYLKTGVGDTAWSLTGTIVALTQGSVAFADSSGNITQDNTNFNYNDATNTLTIANGAVTGALDVNGVLTADGGIDVTATGGSDTLAIGTNNADVINIGRSGATVNVQGTTAYQNVTNYEVTDKNITVNKGGSAGSASAAGVEIEENSSITGYSRTSADRNSWEMKAPNTAGIASITPGASGITLDQSSHDPFTLASVGSSPSASGASLSGQQLTLQPADGSNPGLVTAGTQTIGGNKTFSGTIAASNLSGTNTGDVTITDSNSVNLSLTGQALSADVRRSDSTIDEDASGLKVGATSLSNSHISNSAAIAYSKLASLTASRVLESNGSGVISASSVTSTTLSYLDATSSIQTQLNSKAALVTGDIAPTSFSASNNISSPADVTGLSFSSGSIRSFEALVSIYVDATSDLFETVKIYGINKGSSWSISQTSTGDTSGFEFTITNAGQIQYTNSNYSGFSSATVKFRAEVLGI